MEKKDWEYVYKSKGIVQNDILNTVKNAANSMFQNGYTKVLDLCCGTGRHSIYLASRGFEVYGIDISQTAINISQNRINHLKLKNVYLKVGDLFNINFSDNFFDAVLCVWSTGHGMKSDIKKSIEEMYRVVREGGCVYTDFMSIKDKDFKRGVQLEENTFLHDHIDHPDVPHHYCSLSELNSFFSSFKTKKIIPVTYPDPQFNSDIKSFWVEAIK